METIYFISDIHLVETRPELSLLFKAFIASIVGKAKALYILGDWFATWTGPDTQNNFFNEIVSALKPLQAQGTKLYFMPGNRDFLLNQTSLAPYGIQLLNDPTLLSLNTETTVLLLHGDSLCTLDKNYQYYRSCVRHPWTQSFFLHLPIWLRKMIANTLRKNSKSQYAQKPTAYLDVSPKAVEAFFQEYQCQWMLHGHVHKAAVYDRRLVLGDWGKSGSVIQWDGRVFELTEFFLS